MARDTQLKMTYGRFSVYSEPFDNSASDEVMEHIQDELNKRFVQQTHIPLGAEIVCEFIESSMMTGMFGFFGSLIEDATPDKENN